MFVLDIWPASPCWPANVRQFVETVRCKLFVRSLFTFCSANLLPMPGGPIIRMSQHPESDFWEEFIELYKARPALWKYGSNAYRDRRGKRLAYLELVQKLKEIEPKASVDMVKRKINSLRACFRRESCKMRRSSKNGESPATRWRFFDNFSFLRDYNKDPLDEAEEQDETIGQDNDVDDDILGETTFEYIVPKVEQRIKRKSTPSSPPRREESANVSYKQLKHEHDEADILGLSWSYQYRDLTKDQKLYAKKAIDDILFEARLETLHRNSVRINETSCSTCGSAQFIELSTSPHKHSYNE